MSTADSLWMCLGGVSIYDQCLTSKLIGNGHGPEGVTCKDCAPCCDDLLKGMGGDTPTNIGAAPWYDPSEPDSVDFAGLLVTEVTGLAPGVYTRPVTESSNVGAILGQARQAAPLITVTGILMAATCCGADYGYAWLRNALKGSCTATQLCQGDDLKFLTCEPQTPDFDCMTPQEVADFDYVAWLDPYVRTFKNAALVAGPTITNRIPRGCPECHECGFLEVQFTLSAADPCVYREPVLMEDPPAFDCDLDANDECVEFIPAGHGLSCGCAAAPDCATDPDCVDVSPPAMPSLTSACVTDCLGVDRCRTCFDVPVDSFPVNGEGTLYMEIYAGTAAMRGIQISIWANPTEADADDLSECNKCAELNISYIGPDSTLVIDGAARTAMITCPGGTAVRANRFISGTGNTPAFEFPVFEGCASGVYTVCVEVNSPIAANAAVRNVMTQGREC